MYSGQKFEFLSKFLVHFWFIFGVNQKVFSLATYDYKVNPYEGSYTSLGTQIYNELHSVYLNSFHMNNDGVISSYLVNNIDEKRKFFKNSN